MPIISGDDEYADAVCLCCGASIPEAPLRGARFRDDFCSDRCYDIANRQADMASEWNYSWQAAER